jgi:DNA-binding response OmpR family regulator
MNRPLRVLIVEDSEADVELLLRALRRGGYEAAYDVVETPAAMRAALARQAWDLITADHAIPGFNAPAALALAKEVYPDAPFLIVSGEIDLNLAVSLMREGARDYIPKGELARLVPAIARALRDVEGRRERQRAEAALADQHRMLAQTHQELRRKHEEIQSFYHMLSHELKTPLTAVREFVAIVLEGLAGPLSEAQRQYLTIRAGQLRSDHARPERPPRCHAVGHREVPHRSGPWRDRPCGRADGGRHGTDRPRPRHSSAAGHRPGPPDRLD